MKIRIFKSSAALLLTAAMLVAQLVIPEGRSAEAATTYITVQDFAKALATEMDLEPVSGSQSSGYVNILMEKGIIKEGDFSSYTNNITRGDTLVLMNRADEYLYGDTADEKLVQRIIKERISDIKSVAGTKREDVAKAYLKGYMKGFSNGEYSTNRKLKVKGYFVKNDALRCIRMLKDNTLRAKISPDGQLIRTTNLPVYAEYYPYILASFPNDYYDWKFDYEGQSRYNPSTGERTPYINLKDYAAPADVDKTTKFEDFPSVKEEYLDIWVGKVRTYMEHVFNVDYRTIDDGWAETVLKTDYTYKHDTQRDRTKADINEYISAMKDNKTIVECSKVAVDGSSLYYFNGNYFLRTCVRFRIVSSIVSDDLDSDFVILERPFNDILYTRFPLVEFTSFQLGEWREGHFDVELARYDKRDGADLGIAYVYLNEFFYEEGRLDK